MNKNRDTLHKSFEKLTKVALIKIDKQQVSDVIRILNEFDEILKLFIIGKNKKTDQFIGKFIDLVITESVDSKLKVIESEFIRLYIVSFIQIWKASTRKQSYEISKSSIQTLNNGFVRFRCDSFPMIDSGSINNYYKCNQSFLDFFNIVASETSVKEDINLICEFLFDYIIWTTQIANPLLESYLKLLMNPLDSEIIDESTLTTNSISLNEPYSEGIQVFCDLFFTLWKKAFNLNFENSAYNIVSIIEKILRNLLSKKTTGKDFLTISSYFIRLIQNINVEISLSQQKFSPISARASYTWFFQIVFDENFNLNQIVDLQIPLFISVRTSIIDNNKKLFLSFIDHIIHSSFHPSIGMLPDLDFQTRQLLKDFAADYEKAKSKLLTESRLALTLQDFNKVIVTYGDFKSILNEYSNVNSELIDDILSEYKLFIEKQFKYKIVQQTVIWLGCYCLFMKQYDYIEDLLYYNQPKDSTVHWVNKDINPLNIGEIFTLYYRRHDLDRNITFLWDSHHEFLTYYDQYLAILLMNALNQNLRKGETWRNEFTPYYDNFDKSVQEIEGIGYSLDNLCRIVKSLKINESILKGCGLSDKLADSAIKLLENSSSSIEKHKQEIKVSAEIDPEKAQSFIDNINESYKKRGALKNIINYYRTISEINDPKQCNNSFIAYLNEITPKSFFARNDNGTYIGWPDSYSKKFLFSESMNLKRVFIEKCQKLSYKVAPSMIVQEIDKIGSINENVLIFSNVNPSYEIFGSNPDFVNADQIFENDRPGLREFIGRYKGADVYSYYDETNWKQLLILKKHIDQGIGIIKYYVPTTDLEYNIKEHLYWMILDLNLAPEYIDKLIKEEPYWLLEKASDIDGQRKFLLEQVNVKILYKMGFDLPDDFKGLVIDLE